MNSGKPCSVRLTEGLGRARTERTWRFLGARVRDLWPPKWIGCLAEWTRCIALAFNFPFSTYLPMPRKGGRSCFGGDAKRLPYLPSPAHTRKSSCCSQPLVGYLALAQTSNLRLTIEFAERSTD